MKLDTKLLRYWPVWGLVAAGLAIFLASTWWPEANQLGPVLAVYFGAGAVWVALSRRGRRVLYSASTAKRTWATDSIKFAIVASAFGALVLAWFGLSALGMIGGFILMGGIWALTSTLLGDFTYESDRDRKRCPACGAHLSLEVVPVGEQLFVCPQCFEALMPSDVGGTDVTISRCPGCENRIPPNQVPSGEAPVVCLRCDTVSRRPALLSPKQYLLRKAKREAYVDLAVFDDGRRWCPKCERGLPVELACITDAPIVCTTCDAVSLPQELLSPRAVAIGRLERLHSAQ